MNQIHLPQPEVLLGVKGLKYCYEAAKLLNQYQTPSKRSLVGQNAHNLL